MRTAAGTFDLPVGFNEWKTGTVVISDKKYEALGDIVGEQRLAASAAVQDDGSVKLRLHLLHGPRRMDFHFRTSFLKPMLKGKMAGAGGFE